MDNNFGNDFITQMAQMIAAARPQGGGGGGGGSNYVGGTGPGAITSRAKETSVGISIPSHEQVQSVFGQQTDRSKLMQAEAAHETAAVLQSTQPELLQQQESNPDYQKRMKSWHDAGYNGIVQDPTDPNRYEWVPKEPNHERWVGAMKALTIKPGTPEAMREMTRAPSEVEVASGQMGEEPRATMVKTQQQGKEMSDTALAQQKDLEVTRAQAEPPSMTALHNAEAAMHKANKEHMEAQTATLPAKSAAEIAESRAKTSYYQAAAGKEATEAQKYRQDLGQKLPIEQRQGLLEADKAFNGFWQAYTDKNSSLGDSEQVNFKKLAELAPAVQAHIAAVKHYSGEGAGGEMSVDRYLALADREFERPTAKAGWAIVGAGQKPVEDQKALRRYYLKKGVEMVQAMGSSSPTEITTLAKWARQLGIDQKALVTVMYDPTVPADVLFRQAQQPQQGQQQPQQGVK